MTQLVLGRYAPMDHQAEDVERLSSHPRINVWNGLGTGKTATVAWWLQRLWWSEVVDEAVLVLPSMTARDWRETLEFTAWPEGLVDFWDCRPPRHTLIGEAFTESARPPGHRFRVMCTTYGGARALMDGRTTGKRYRVDESGQLMSCVRGRRIAAVFDESQGAALQSSQQGIACRALASACRSVASVTATPIGNPIAMRLWGMAKLVRPDLLTRVVPPPLGSVVPKVGSFNAFKARYGFLNDPRQDQAARQGRTIPFNINRAYPVSVDQVKLKNEILAPMAPFTTRRAKEDCLDLPPKVFMRRQFRLPAAAERIMDDLVEEDRAVLESGTVIVPQNILVENLRTYQLCGGWLAGEPVHDGKLRLLEEVLGEIRENLGSDAPILVWARGSRELVGSALVAAGTPPREAFSKVSACYPPGESAPVRALYVRSVKDAEGKGVGLIHGPTADSERDRIQDEWKAGRLRVVVAHPGVAGAGLNWQHVKASVYYSSPGGSIARNQSEDRVHRKGLEHTALYYDLTVEGGPDEAVVMAHRREINVEAALLQWLADRAGHR